jgi:hypothetical protein
LSFNGSFVDGSIRIEGIYWGTKGDHFTQFGADSSDSIMQSPLKVNDAVDEFVCWIGWARTSACHLYFDVIEGGEQMSERSRSRKNITTDDHASVRVFRQCR